jgi:FixJ family two-component response regulator
MVKSMPTVAIVDPDYWIYNNLAQLLDGIDVKVSTYPNAESLLEKLDSGHYACIISETCLPGIGGLELLNGLSTRQQPIPIILLTKRTDISLAVRAMQAGAADFIEKPFTEALLLKRIKQIVARDVRLF